MPKPFVFFLLSVLAVASSVQAAESLCASTERTFFSCAIAGSAKVVSVCGASRAADRGSYLQYRFGRPGKIELEFPTNRDGSVKAFGWDSRNHLDVAGDWLWFKNGDFIYSLYVIEDHDTPGRKPEFRTGILIEQQGKNVGGQNMKCAERATGEFQQLSELVEWKQAE